MEKIVLNLLVENVRNVICSIYRYFFIYLFIQRNSILTNLYSYNFKIKLKIVYLFLNITINNKF